MATVTRTIGATGRNYATLSLWRASLPANLVTDNNSYVGECYNDAEFVNDLAALTGHATDATHTITLTAAAGQSFADHANAQTNALRYNQANGVGIRTTTNYRTTAPIQVADSNVTISRLQLQKGGNYQNTVDVNGSSNFTLTKNIMVGGDAADAVVRLLGGGTGWFFTNNLIIVQSGGVGVTFQNNFSAGMTACSFNTIVAHSTTVGTTAISMNYGTNTIKNCAMFGFTNLVAGGGTQTFTTCMTDKSSPPTGCTQVTYANQFVNTTSGAADFRVKSGADLINAATTDATYGATDIVGTTRPQGASYDIGAWEFASAAPPYRPRVVRWG
jgi:hypothetical protein